MEREEFRLADPNMTVELVELQLIDEICQNSLVAPVKMGRVRRAIMPVLPVVAMWFAT